MNNNLYNNFETSDLIDLLSFLAQIQNIKLDGEEKEYIHNFIKTIAKEVEDLHKENNRIETKIDMLLKILEERE